MKSKKNIKNLAFTKETISNLNSVEGGLGIVVRTASYCLTVEPNCQICPTTMSACIVCP